MPWRLIVVIVIFAVFLAFITFNLDNRCDISFGFAVFKGVPVFLTVFISFVVGLFCTLPFILRTMKTRPEIDVKEKTPSKYKYAGHFKNAGKFSDGGLNE